MCMLYLGTAILDCLCIMWRLAIDFFPFLLSTLIRTSPQLKVFPRKNLLVRGRQFATKAHLEQNLGPLCDGRYNIKWNSLFTHLIYWIGEGSRTHRRADCLWETLFGGLSLSLPPELHTQFVPNPGDIIRWVLQVCGFRLAVFSRCWPVRCWRGNFEASLPRGGAWSPTSREPGVGLKSLNDLVHLCNKEDGSPCVCPISHFGICYETQLTNTNIKVSKTSQLSWAINSGHLTLQHLTES